uniref:Uncharacterized protein n=1 Tax=Ciona intestinalis TaxID=7719 RepID=F6USS4_CIOIN
FKKRNRKHIRKTSFFITTASLNSYIRLALKLFLTLFYKNCTKQIVFIYFLPTVRCFYVFQTTYQSDRCYPNDIIIVSDGTIMVSVNFIMFFYNVIKVFMIS